MNYTENYHLPQWDEDDRIFRKDFNQMCADMEAGLSKNTQAAEAAQDHSEALENKSFRQFYRAAYNHLRTIWDMGTTPQQWGVFREKTPSTIQWYSSGAKEEPFTPVGKWHGTPDSDSFFQALKQVSALYIVPDDETVTTPLVVNFTPAGGGTIPYLAVQGSFNTVGAIATTPTPYRLTCTNLDTGKIEYQMDGDFGFNFNSGAPTVQIPVNILFHSGQHYQIKVEALFAHAKVNFSLVPTYAFQPVFFQTGTVSRTHTFLEEENGEGGVFLVYCGSYGAGGKISLTLNGEDIPASQVRTYWDGRNALAEERIYRKPENIPGGSTLTLTVTANTGGDLSLYGWGAALL